jgi:hydroxymethylglutaryl-CoA reductase (NADPH)
MEGDDYTERAVGQRQAFVEEFTGTELEHVEEYSFEPSTVDGNIENFTGVAQIPLGVAGPVQVDGQHAAGEFLIPMATTEGTLVASFSRGMKALNRGGGVTTTVTRDNISRDPTFKFDSGRTAAEFCDWLDEHLEEIRRQAEATSNHLTLDRIETYPYNRMVYTNFFYDTGDAAGQNMIGLGTYAAASWILTEFPDQESVRGFQLGGNTSSEKRHSAVGFTEGRGKQVTAEATIPAEAVQEILNATPETVAETHDVSNVGALVSGSNTNACHVPNGVSAVFIATGQDEANVVEASAASMVADVTPEGDLDVSITVPSLITATVGGGTHLPTQQECLEMLDCLGEGNVEKFTEIVAAVILAGEVSLMSAITASDWVDAHEALGRNRESE